MRMREGQKFVGKKISSPLRLFAPSLYRILVSETLKYRSFPEALNRFARSPNIIMSDMKHDVGHGDIRHFHWRSLANHINHMMNVSNLKLDVIVLPPCYLEEIIFWSSLP